MLELQHISKTYGGSVVLRDISVHIAHGERVPEFEVPGSEPVDFTGRAARSDNGYRIVWNPARLNAEMQRGFAAGVRSQAGRYARAKNQL